MKEILKKLEEFRIARNIDCSQGRKFVLNKEVGFMLSEAAEYLDAENDFDRVDALCDISVFAINAYYLLMPSIEDSAFYYAEASQDSATNIVFIINNINNLLKDYPMIAARLPLIVKYCKLLLEDMGYDFKDCMLETIEEISSRKQSPSQAIEWQENGTSGKWQKDKNQDNSTLYVANYSSCKVQNVHISSILDDVAK